MPHQIIYLGLLKTYVYKPHFFGGDTLAKAGMRRPDVREPHGTESNKKLHIKINDVLNVPQEVGKRRTDEKKNYPSKELY